MKKLLLILILINLRLSLYAQQAIEENYYFITEVGFLMLKQSGDTLYSYKCQKDFSCHDFGAKHYKILATENIGDYVVLKMESLDSMSMTTNPFPEDRFSIVIIKFISDKSLIFIQEANRYTHSQLDTIQISQSNLDQKFGYTYYTKNHLYELSKRKKISSKSEIEELLKLFETYEYQAIIEKYRNTKTGDMYGRGLMYELFYKAAIDNGYNPIDAVEIVNKLMR
jgi:hypothetical protein